jgi:hypothetical protein
MLLKINGMIVSSSGKILSMLRYEEAETLAAVEVTNNDH